MENTFSQFDESVIELQNVLRQTKQRKRGPNLTEQMRADIYQAHLEKVDQNAIAATYGLTLQTIKKAIREKEEQRMETALEAPFVVKLDSLKEEPEVEPEPDAEIDEIATFESEPQLDEDAKTEPEAKLEAVSVETQPSEVEYLIFPVEDQLEAVTETGIVDEPKDEAEKDIEIEALLVHYIFSLYDANILSPFEAATFIRRL